MHTGCINPIPFNLSNPDKFMASITDGKFTSLGLDFKNAKGEEPAEMQIFDVIGKDWDGSGVGAKDVSAFLAENRGKPVNVLINSVGGLVYDGITIYNSLIAHDAPVTTTITGLAASIASVVAMAGSKVRMSAVASMMTHCAHGVCIGNKADMTDCSKFLNKIDGQIADIYAAKSGRKSATMLGYMEAGVDGTFFNAQDALDAKLIDEIIPVRGDKKNSAKNEMDLESVDSTALGETMNETVARAQAENARRVSSMRAAARLRLMEIESNG